MPMPRVSSIEIPPNCRGGNAAQCLGDRHHCAKLFEARVEIEGVTKKPTIELPDTQSAAGVYQQEPLLMKMRFDQEEVLKTQFLQVKVDTESQYETTNKVIGLQFCRPPKGITNNMITWNRDTGLCTLHIKLRVRRIYQGGEGWEFRDDAGSGTRGKAHSLSQFRFSARLLTDSKDEGEDIDQTTDHSDDIDCRPRGVDCAICHARVWSKGNCPSRRGGKG